VGQGGVKSPKRSSTDATKGRASLARKGNFGNCKRRELQDRGKLYWAMGGESPCEDTMRSGELRERGETRRQSADLRRTNQQNNKQKQEGFGSFN